MCRVWFRILQKYWSTIYWHKEVFHCRELGKQDSLMSPLWKLESRVESDFLKGSWFSLQTCCLLCSKIYSELIRNRRVNRYPKRINDGSHLEGMAYVSGTFSVFFAASPVCSVIITTLHMMKMRFRTVNQHVSMSPGSQWSKRRSVRIGPLIHHPRHLSQWILLPSYEVETIVNPMLQLKKLKFNKMKWLAEDHS